MLSTDLESLAAILAKRTPGELQTSGSGGAIVDANFEPFANAWGGTAKSANEKAAIIVAAVNACGPLIERVRELERCHKAMSQEVAKYIVLAGKSKNEVAKLEEELQRKRRASIVTPQIEALESQLAAVNERIAEAERLGLFDHRAAAIESRKRADAAEAQLAAANARVEELEGQVISLRVGSAACDQAADDDEEVIESLEAENKRLLERVRELEEHVIEIECENGSLLRQIAAANERIAEAERLLRRHLRMAETAQTVVPNNNEAIVAACDLTDDTHKFLEAKL